MRTLSLPEIQVCELAVIFLCGLVVGARCFLWRRIAPKIQALTANFDAGIPTSISFVETNTLKTSRVISSTFPIVGIFLIGHAAEILFTIVQSLVVFMVTALSRLASQYFSMHGDHGAVGATASRVKTIHSLIPVSKPVPLREPLKVLGVHDGGLALRECDKSVRFIQRLRNGMPWFRLSGHVPAPTGICCAAILLLFLFVPASFSQTSTTVSGTITDAGGQAWIRGTFSFTFKVAASNPTAQYYWNGVPFSSSQTFAGDLDGSGHFSVSIPSNTAITPAQSTWVLTVCSVARGNSPCYTTQGMTISGATQDISSTVTPPAISIDLTHVAYPFVTAYTSSEITTATFGGLFYNFLQTHYFVCEAISPTGVDQSYGHCTLWVEICQVGDGLCGGAGLAESFQHNGTLVGTQPTFNVIDTGTVVATLTNDILNNRVNVSFAAASGTGCTVGALLDQWVLSIHPDHTCYGSVDWLWDDTLWNNTQGDGTNILSLTNSLAFTQGHGNHQTDATYSWQNGFDNTVTCDSNTVGTSDCTFFFGTGKNNLFISTGASSSGSLAYLEGDSNIFSITGGSSGSNLMLLLNSNQATAESGGHIDDSILAGKQNSVDSTGSGSVTSSIYHFGENNGALSSAGGHMEDAVQLGENNAVTAINASSEAGFHTQTGYNHTFISQGGFGQSYGFSLGHLTSGTSTTTNMTEFGMIGHNLSVTDCSHCYLFGENGVWGSGDSNKIGIGYSATPELIVQSGITSLTGTLALNGPTVTKIIAFTYCAVGCTLTGTPCTASGTEVTCTDAINFSSLGTFADTNYSAQCMAIGPHDSANPPYSGRVTFMGALSKATGTVTALTASQGSTAVHWDEIDCTLTHR